ncbi:hypothetical protein [Marinoscillum sp.]|uniref:leucine-rich repeat domain-containing protein n=1 Tax=Marinoscillum sp. TaxID=2024838 RepID=UPI003BAC8FB5
MKKSILLAILLSSVFTCWSQKDELTREQDSVRQIMEERMKRWEAQRAIYQRMYADDPQNAIDSVIAAEKMDNRPMGLNRLASYQRNERIDTLKELNLSYAGLEEVPAFVFQAKAMEVLILDYNDIKKLPKELGELPNLKRVYWRANNLDDYWWVRIQKMGGIEKLDISNNLLTRLPMGVKNLDGLKELVVDQNFIGEIPVKRLSKAQTVKTVSFNKSHSMAIQKADYSKLAFLKVLKINNSGIDAIDPSFYQLDQLDELQLQENSLTTIPAGISKMENLTKLSFYKNKLEDLPNDLFEMNLKVIDLYYNNLEVIPETIGNFKDLEILFLAHNRIYSLPETIGQLTRLEEFYVHHNRLSVLPESVSGLTNLRVARVNDNYLTEFPDQFLGMKSLEDFDVSNNQLTTLDPGVEQLPSLELFSYQENPIDFQSQENKYVSPMIVRMLDRGVSCIPRIYQEEVAEQENGR